MLNFTRQIQRKYDDMNRNKRRSNLQWIRHKWGLEFETGPTKNQWGKWITTAEHFYSGFIIASEIRKSTFDIYGIDGNRWAHACVLKCIASKVEDIDLSKMVGCLQQ